MDHFAAPNLNPEGKSSLAFRTISEVSVEIDVPQHVLRFWESRFSQVKPMKRGGGRRYYRPEDVELLRQIKTYLYKHGYTIKGVQRLLKEHKMRDLPSLAAYRLQAAEESDHAIEAPPHEPEDFEQTFEVSLSEVTAPEEPAPIPGTQAESSLAVITQIRDEIAVPLEPMRVQSAAELVAQSLLAVQEEAPPAPERVVTHIASKETGFMPAPPDMEARPLPLKASDVPAGLPDTAKAELGEVLDELRALRTLLLDEAA